MPYKIDIDHRRSLSRKRLYLKSFWERVMDPALGYFTAFFFVVSAPLLYRSIDWSSPNDSVIGKIYLPLATGFGMALAYKKSAETKLVCIDVDISRTCARSIILKYMQQEGFKVLQNNRDFVIGMFDGAFEAPRQLTVLFEEGRCHVNVLKLGGKMRGPSFFINKEYVRGVRKFLRETACA